MAKIFSWKVGNGKYAYLIKDEDNNTYIRNRVSDKAILLSWSTQVDQFTEEEYEEAFNNLKDEVLTACGYELGTYDQYYNTYDAEDEEPQRVILLSGKDGDGAHGRGNTELTEQSYNAIIQIVDDRFNVYKEEVEEAVANAVTEISENIQSEIESAMADIAATQAQLEAQIQRVDSLIQSAQNILTRLNYLGPYVNTDITQTDVINSVITAQRYGAFLDVYQMKLAGISADYDNLSSQLNTNGTNTFMQFAENVDNMGDDMQTLTLDLANVSATTSDSVNWYSSCATTISNGYGLITTSQPAITDLNNYLLGYPNTTIGSMVTQTASAVSQSIVNNYVDTTSSNEDTGPLT